MVPVTEIRARSNGQFALIVDGYEQHRGTYAECELKQSHLIRALIRGELRRNTPSMASLGRTLANRIAR